MKSLKLRDVTAGLALLVFCLSCTPVNTPPLKVKRSASRDPIQLYDEGTMHLNEGHLAEAQNVFRQVVLDNPDNAPAWNNLGKAYLLDHKYDEAADSFSQAIKLVPSFADAHMNLGVLYMHTDKLDKADQEFLLARQDAVKRQSPLLWENMGILQIKRKDLGKAIQYFNECLNRNERYYPCLLKRGECFEELGKPQQAMEDYQKTSDYMPNSDELLFKLGRVMIKLGKYSDARPLLERVSIIAPESPRAKEAEKLLETLP